MTTETQPPQPGDLKVWYIPQVPMQPFERTIRHREGTEERELALAVILLDTITSFSIFEFENRIKPDYSDVGGISRWEDDGTGSYDWFDIEEEIIAELMDDLEGLEK